MKQYSIFQTPVLSFFSKSLYRDVFLRWKTPISFAYILLLVSVCMIPLTIMIDQVLTDFVDNVAPEMVSQFPTLTIVDGKASIDKPEPYYIVEPETDKVMIVVDTTGSITSIADTDIIVLVTETGVIFRKSEYQTRGYSFHEVDYFLLDQERMNGWLSNIKSFAALVLYPFILLGSLVITIIQALIYAAVGLIFASLCNCKRSYDELIRLSFIAMTPCIIIEAILEIPQITIPADSLLYILMTLGYLYFGIKATTTDEEAPTKF